MKEGLKIWARGWGDTIKRGILLYGGCCALSLVPVAYESVLGIYSSVVGTSVLDPVATRDYRTMLEEREAISRSESEPWAMPSQKDKSKKKVKMVE